MILSLTFMIDSSIMYAKAQVVMQYCLNRESAIGTNTVFLVEKKVFDISLATLAFFASNHSIYFIARITGKRSTSMVHTEHHPVTYSVLSMLFWSLRASVWHHSHRFCNRSCTDTGKPDTHARAAISNGPAKFHRVLCTCGRSTSSGLIATNGRSNGLWICCHSWKSSKLNWAVPWNGKWIFSDSCIEPDEKCFSSFFRFLDMHMYITSALQKSDMKAVGLQLALDLLHEKVIFEWKIPLPEINWTELSIRRKNVTW